MKLVNEILLWVSVWSVVLPAVSGTIVFRKLDIPSRFIWLMIVCAVVPQLIRYFIEAKPLLYLIYNLCILTEFSFSVCYFWSLFTNRHLIRSFLLVYTIIFLLLYILFINFQGFGNFFSELVCINNLFVVACILICFYTELKLKGIDLISILNPHFLYFMGWMLYAPVTLLVFALWDFLKKKSKIPTSELMGNTRHW